MRYVLAIAFLFAATQSLAADPVEIPLKDILAYRMPGTRNVRELRNGLLMDKIIKAISETRRPASEGFAVVGSGADALRNANRVLGKHVEPTKTFSDEEVSLVFFSHEFNYYVHLSRIERRGNAFDIEYEFVPHDTKELTAQFALIPVGKLPVGDYEVKISSLPLSDIYKGSQPVTKELEQRIVCKSFSFSVK